MPIDFDCNILRIDSWSFKIKSKFLFAWFSAILKILLSISLTNILVKYFNFQVMAEHLIHGTRPCTVTHISCERCIVSMTCTILDRPQVLHRGPDLFNKSLYGSKTASNCDLMQWLAQPIRFNEEISANALLMGQGSPFIEITLSCDFLNTFSRTNNTAS